MYPKRISQDDEPTSQEFNTPVVAETLRSAGATPPAAPKEEEKLSVFWRVFGGTILSIAALVGVTLYNNINASIGELRAEATRAREALAGAVKREDLDREREARAGLARKEDVDARVKSLYERLRTFEGLKGDIEAVKERATTAAAAVDVLKKDVGGSVDALKKETTGIELLRERLTILTGETKLASEAVTRMQSELEKNRAGDLERKLFRDAQTKAIDDSLRELQRAVQDCREKLARLEGANPGGSPVPGRTPAPTPRPTEPKTGD